MRKVTAAKMARAITLHTQEVYHNFNPSILFRRFAHPAKYYASPSPFSFE